MHTTKLNPEGSITLQGYMTESFLGHTEDSYEIILKASPVKENENKTESQKTIILEHVETNKNFIKSPFNKEKVLAKYEIEVGKLIKFIEKEGTKTI